MVLIDAYAAQASLLLRSVLEETSQGRKLAIAPVGSATPERSRRSPQSGASDCTHVAGQ